MVDVVSSLYDLWIYTYLLSVRMSLGCGVSAEDKEIHSVLL